MRALVYDTTSGRIIREMQGDIPWDKQRVPDSQGVIVNQVVSTPDHIATFDAPVSIPADLEGQMVDPAVPEVVTDPNYSSSRSPEAIASDLDSGAITTKEALLEVLRR